VSVSLNWVIHPSTLTRYAIHSSIGTPSGREVPIQNDATTGKCVEQLRLTKQARVANYGVYIPVVGSHRLLPGCPAGRSTGRVKENIVQRGVFTSFASSGALSFSDAFSSLGLGWPATAVQHR
jgi:hypothetical protein